MQHLGKATPISRFTKPMSLLTTLVVTLSLALVLGGASAGNAAVKASGTVPAGTVAHTAAGKLTSTVSGTASNGGTVTGTFVPLKFIKQNGMVTVRGLVNGVVTKSGSTQTFAALRTMKVLSMDGVAQRSGRFATPSASGSRTSAAAVLPSCAILNLVLGPLDLNLLGLKVHLNRVVLNITAQPGPGNLLGNLLCAIAGLLDSGLGGLLGAITAILNQILGQLNLGV